MAVRFILNGYVDQHKEAVYDKVEHSSFSGKIPLCKGVIAYGNILRECEDELHSKLEDWIPLGLKMGHHLTVVGDIKILMQRSLYSIFIK